MSQGSSNPLAKAATADPAGTADEVILLSIMLYIGQMYNAEPTLEHFMDAVESLAPDYKIGAPWRPPTEQLAAGRPYAWDETKNVIIIMNEAFR